MHIDNNDLKKFQSDTMNTEDMIAFLEHIDQCDYCLEQLMEKKLITLKALLLLI